jgi:hypothetical protein
LPDYQGWDMLKDGLDGKIEAREKGLLSQRV